MLILVKYQPYRNLRCFFTHQISFKVVAIFCECAKGQKVNTTRVGVICAARGRVKTKASGIDAIAEREVVRQWIALVNKIQERLVAASTLRIKRTVRL